MQQRSCAVEQRRHIWAVASPYPCINRLVSSHTAWQFTANIHPATEIQAPLRILPFNISLEEKRKKDGRAGWTGTTSPRRYRSRATTATAASHPARRNQSGWNAAEGGGAAHSHRAQPGALSLLKLSFPARTAPQSRTPDRGTPPCSRHGFWGAVGSPGLTSTSWPLPHL